MTRPLPELLREKLKLPAEASEGEYREWERLRGAHAALVKCVELLDQAVDGETRLVVPGDTWADRVQKALAALREEVENG